LNSFERCRSIELRAVSDLIPFLKAKALDGRFVLTNKGRVSEFLQKTVGDALLNYEDGSCLSVEITTSARARP
jgi:hypothetical protein